MQNEKSLHNRDSLPVQQPTDASKKRRKRRAPLVLCLLSPIWLFVGAYVYTSHTYGWAQLFFLWAPNWVIPLVTMTPWDVENGVRDPSDQTVFLTKTGHYAKKLRSGDQNADVMIIYDFLKPDEVERLKSMLGNELPEEYSGGGVASLSKNEDDQLAEKLYAFIRTSTGAWIPEGKYPLGDNVAERISDLTGFSTSNAEEFYIIKYTNGQQFRAHYDLYDYDPTAPFPQYYNNRALTMLMYLNDVEEGGETIFPLAYPPLKLRARAGNAIIWRNCIPESPEDVLTNLKCGKKHVCCKERDFRSIHAGLPVIQGTKVTMTRWIREESEVFRHL